MKESLAKNPDSTYEEHTGHRFKIVKFIEEPNSLKALAECINRLQGWVELIVLNLDNLLQSYYTSKEMSNNSERLKTYLLESEAYITQSASRELLIAFNGKEYIEFRDRHQQECDEDQTAYKCNSLGFC